MLTFVFRGEAFEGATGYSRVRPMKKRTKSSKTAREVKLKRPVLPRAKRKDREQTEVRLLETGLAVFSKYGYDGTTTRTLAEQSGVNESLIIRYFGGKEGLLRTIISNKVTERRNRDPKVPAVLNDLEKELVEYAKEVYADHLSDKDFFRIAVSRCGVDAELRKMLREQVSEVFDPVLVARLEELKTSGEIPRGVSISQIEYTVATEAFAAAFLLHITLGMSEEEARSILVHTIERYVRGLKATEKK
jgi:AcrR family transcriptional regulator